MSQNRTKVFLHAWTGNGDMGIKFAEGRYPEAEISILAHRQLRESGWVGQMRTFARLRGKAIVFYFRSLGDIKEPELLICLHLFHGCRESVLADENGNVRIITLKECIRHFPGLVTAIAADLVVFCTTWLRLRKLRRVVMRETSIRIEEGTPDIAYIYPYPLNRDFSGGATTHFRGFLDGLSENNGTCQVLSGCKLPFTLPFPVELILARRKWFVLSESLMLSYNWQFVRDARKLFSEKKPRVVYQRHGRFVVAGVLLARALGVPLVLEYNGSEVWVASHWDPARFVPWLRTAEEVALWGASTIIVVSEALKVELIARGLPAVRIFVNPNGVDPSKFRPSCGDKNQLRKELGFDADHIVVAFVGTFSYWHGVAVLQGAIQELFKSHTTGRPFEFVKDNLRFLLVGSGPLLAEMRAALREYEEQGRVVFAGVVAHDRVPAYLDATDILASPHVPMPDGQPFIGSPTKLFEYMAMSKAIVASRLDQLEKVLTHNDTALLVQPGNVEDLLRAIVLLAGNEDLRLRLGRNARATAMANCTWKRNAADTLLAAGLRCPPTFQVTRK